jgi:hypothetical protein
MVVSAVFGVLPRLVHSIWQSNESNIESPVAVVGNERSQREVFG